MWSRHTQAELRLIQHLDRQIDRLGTEVHDQRFTLEISFVIHVHFDSWATAIDFLGNDTALGKDVSDLFEFGVEGNRGNE